MHLMAGVTVPNLAQRIAGISSAFPPLDHDGELDQVTPKCCKLPTHKGVNRGLFSNLLVAASSRRTLRIRTTLSKQVTVAAYSRARFLVLMRVASSIAGPSGFVPRRDLDGRYLFHRLKR